MCRISFLMVKNSVNLPFVLLDRRGTDAVLCLGSHVKADSHMTRAEGVLICAAITSIITSD